MSDLELLIQRYGPEAGFAVYVFFRDVFPWIRSYLEKRREKDKNPAGVSDSTVQAAQKIAELAAELEIAKHDNIDDIQERTVLLLEYGETRRNLETTQRQLDDTKQLLTVALARIKDLEAKVRSLETKLKNRNRARQKKTGGPGAGGPSTGTV